MIQKSEAAKKKSRETEKIVKRKLKQTRREHQKVNQNI
jgi:hypothetical protein